VLVETAVVVVVEVVGVHQPVPHSPAWDDQTLERN